MRPPTRGRRLLNRSAGVAGLLALALGSIIVPSAAAAEIPGADAALITIDHQEGQLRVGVADRDGLPVEQGDVIAVDDVGVFAASIDTSSIAQGSGRVTLSIGDVVLPEGAAPGPADSAAPHVRISAADGEQILLGTATDAPHDTTLDAATTLAAQWWFSTPGEYRFTLTAGIGVGGSAVSSDPSTLVFQVAGDPADSPQPAPSPRPEPSAQPEPSAMPDPAPVPEPAPVPTAQPGSAEEIPIPDGQSDQPAPASRAKVVLDHGHIDALTPVLTGGDELPQLNPGGAVQLMMKEDVTALNRLRVPEHVILHVKPDALETIPSGFVSGLSGEAHLLPLTQDQNLIWPGWETQLITAEFPGANTQFVVSEVQGPGDVFLWSQNQSGSVVSLMNGDYRLPATIAQPYPAHTHAAWAFTEPGTYELTVRADITATGGEKASTQTATYTFVVGDLDEHTRVTRTTIEASTPETAQGEAMLFTSEVAPEGVEGAVQFRDIETNVVLGHTPVTDGVAEFRVDSLTPGPHRIVAEFMPTWSNDATTSTSDAVTITVGGDVQPRPDFDDTEPVSAAEIAARTPGTSVAITSPGKRIAAGETLTARVTDPDAAGQWLSVWLPGQNPAWRGWVQADLNGDFSVDTPTGMRAGTRQLVVKRDDGTFIGWDSYVVRSPAGGDGGGTAPPPDPKPAPQPKPQAPGQQCVPGVTLEHGHIDAFYVSAANGKAVLQLMEDVTGYRVIREAESVLLRVKESAYRASIPAPGGPRGYVLPLTQDANLIWPGWDTNRTSASGYTDVTINVTGVDGPGRVFMYSQGSFGDWKPILSHGGYALPGAIREATPAHTHAQWVFPEKGIYKLTAHAVATNPDTGASLRTAPHTYVFQVGDVPLGDAFCGLSSADAAAAVAVNHAVNDAALAAVAAAQAEAEAEAEEKPENDRTRQSDSAVLSDDDGLLAGILGGDLHPAVIGGIVGGGILIVGGIIGGTIWYVRRLGSSTLDASTPDAGTGAGT